MKKAHFLTILSFAFSSGEKNPCILTSKAPRRKKAVVGADHCGGALVLFTDH
jgi:hypothetical protein